MHRLPGIQSIDHSDAPLARDLRVLVRERLAAGDTDQHVARFPYGAVRGICAAATSIFLPDGHIVAHAGCRPCARSTGIHGGIKAALACREPVLPPRRKHAWRKYSAAAKAECRRHSFAMADY